MSFPGKVHLGFPKPVSTVPLKKGDDRKRASCRVFPVDVLLHCWTDANPPGLERHQHPGLFMCKSKDFLVAWVLVPIASPLGIVAGA